MRYHPPVPPAAPVRFGVLGCAEIARRRMMPAMAAAPDVELAAVGSRSAHTAAAMARRHGGRPVAGYANLLADDGVDAVYLPLPVALHDQWVEAALLAGKHVLAEKPLTTDPRRTRELLALAQRRGLVLRENVMFVHHPQHAVVRRLLAAGAIGELRALHAVFAIPARADTDIRHDPELGGGALWDVGLYPVRAAVHLLGPGLETVGATLSVGAGRRVDTAGAALLRRADGVTAQLTFGMEHAYRSAYQVWGSAGRITVDRAFTPPADEGPRILLERSGGTEPVEAAAADQAVRTLAEFAAAVRTVRAGGTDAHDHTDLLAQADLLTAMRAAAAL
ncbi:Gfo/Idh/MocA family protein [Streptomyces sp. NBC_00986]|uniref:Gfo/Idh/MocA family protein n=1 Tax=Streptomyces sp. NBC_00986 TaxID=2903702 RepID=UPI00386D537A|nr:Gfo/Idh/MocA family oxidoreductase [Streptomyces sp. NBC_00986]WSX64487.1 Gfo/Idh/MocA family oxidoreductase [Streptomyces sp. NBC_00986]